MTLRRALKGYVKTLRELAHLSRPSGPVDTDGKLVLMIHSDQMLAAADRLEELMRDHR